MFELSVEQDRVAIPQRWLTHEGGEVDGRVAVEGRGLPSELGGGVRLGDQPTVFDRGDQRRADLNGGSELTLCQPVLGAALWAHRRGRSTRASQVFAARATG